MSDTVEIVYEITGAFPGYEVLYYTGKSTYRAEPVVAWAIGIENAVSAQAFPITMDAAWPLDESRHVQGPDGVVRHDDAHWGSITEWLTDMQGREDRTVNISTKSLADSEILSLDNFRRRASFQSEG